MNDKQFCKRCINCKWIKVVNVRIPADLSHTKKAFWKKVAIDHCIADLVAALQREGINMRGSCCGHGKGPGEIHFQNGTVLLVTQYARYLRFRDKFPKYLRWL